MKIQVNRIHNPDYGETQELIIDGKRILTVRPLCECPEAATIERDLLSCLDIAWAYRKGYEACKRGESLTVIVDGYVAEELESK